jgi:hypothetical protein
VQDFSYYEPKRANRRHLPRSDFGSLFCSRVSPRARCLPLSWIFLGTRIDSFAVKANACSGFLGFSPRVAVHVKICPPLDLDSRAEETARQFSFGFDFHLVLFVSRSSFQCPRPAAAQTRILAPWVRCPRSGSPGGVLVFSLSPESAGQGFRIFSLSRLVSVFVPAWALLVWCLPLAPVPLQERAAHFGLANRSAPGDTSSFSSSAGPPSP